MTDKNDRKYFLVDKATFIYMAALSLVILIFYANLPNWMTYIAFNLGICVSVALVVLVYARRHNRLLYYIFFPLVATLLVATVYGRFHYVFDVAAGLLVGWGSLLLCDRFIKKKTTSPRQEMVEKEFSLDLTKLD